MPAALTDEQREAVLAAARTGATRNEVARRTGVSAASVTRICKTAGVTFDRTRTAVAVQARVLDMKQARTALAVGLLDDIATGRQLLHSAEDSREFFDYARSVSVLANAHVRIVAVDHTDDNGAEEARSLLGNLMVALRVRHAQDTDDGDDSTTRQPDSYPTTGDPA